MTNNQKAPFVLHSAKPISLSMDVFIATLPLMIFSVVFFGLRPIVMLAINIVTALLCECFASLLMHKKPQITDGTSAVTAILITGMVSPIAPFWLTILATAFAILLVKMAFGGTGRNIFNPAAAGIALITTCFSNLVFMYPDNDVKITTSIFTFDVATAVSPGYNLQTGGSGSYSWYELLMGQVPGAIGATAILVLCACGVYLFVRHAASPAITLSFLTTCAVLAVLFPRTEGSFIQSILLELCSGYLFYGSIFLLNDPVTSPNHTLARILYGILAGILVMVFRHMGRFEEGMCYAVLLANTTTFALDRFSWSYLHNRKRRKEERI